MTNKARRHRFAEAVDTFAARSQQGHRGNHGNRPAIPTVPAPGEKVEAVKESAARRRRRDNETTTEGNRMEPTPVTLAELVAEGFGGSVFGAPNINTLERLLTVRGIEIMLDDVGRRVVSRDVARQLFTERAQQAAERAQAEQRRAEAAADPNSVAARVRALQARVAQRQAEGRWDPTLSAHAQMLGDEAESDLERAGRRRDQLHDAEAHGFAGTGAMFNPQRKG